MHQLVLPPGRRTLNGHVRMPMIHDVQRVLAHNLQATLMDRDAMRRVKTTARNAKLQGPVASPQRFTAPGGVLTEPAMIAGAHKMNARRLVSKTRGQSAGIA